MFKNIYGNITTRSLIFWHHIRIGCRLGILHKGNSCRWSYCLAKIFSKSLKNVLVFKQKLLFSFLFFNKNYFWINVCLIMWKISFIFILRIFRWLKILKNTPYIIFVLFSVCTKLPCLYIKILLGIFFYLPLFLTTNVLLWHCEDLYLRTMVTSYDFRFFRGMVIQGC